MAQQRSEVTVIPAKRASLLTSAQTPAPIERRKTAGYARVSTDSDEQLNSYEAQVDYYTKFIQSRPDWQLTEVYTDEGISAVNTKRREGFKRMIRDALDGKMSLIVTKSVSRFARNTVDSLQTIRKLKEAGCEVYFEKEGIWTFDGKGELLITIMSSLAQEESRNLSENVTWGHRKRMADGKISLPWKSILGYEKGEDGLPKIVEAEAPLVREIFAMFMKGKTFTNIARELTSRGIPTPMGHEQWRMATIRGMLQSEVYRGSIRMQKTYCTNYLTKSKKENEGELPMFYIEHSHEPIIPPDEWDAVQVEIERRKGIKGALRCQTVFSMKIVCGDCGGFFGSKVWNSTHPQWRKVIWRCNDRYNKTGKKNCATSHITELELKYRFMAAYNKLLLNRDALLEDCADALRLLCDTKAIDTELTELALEVETTAGLSLKAIEQRAREPIDQSEWIKHGEVYLKRHAEATRRIAELEALKKERTDKVKVLKLYIRNLQKQTQPLTDFDEDIWCAVIDCVVVNVDGSYTFKFKDGAELIG
jgi:DNA invertase Pin-like site-specific DNA recombinase